MTGNREEESGEPSSRQETGPASPAPSTPAPPPVPGMLPPAGEPAPPVPGLAEIEDRTFEAQVEHSRLPVVLMFYSPLCVYCRQVEPYFRRFAEDYPGKIVFARLNVLANPWTAERYGVRSTPTFAFFCGGKAIREMVGAVYPALITKMVDEVLVHGKECAEKSTEIDYEITGYG